MSKWREAGAPDDQAWRCPPGLTAAERTAEQDQAAGAHANRAITIDGRTALASVALRRKRDGRRVYAYLRWSSNGKTTERYLGEVDKPTRKQNLAQAWRLASPLVHPADPAGDRPAGREDLPPESWASSPAVRAVMRGNKGKDTRPELAVRSASHALGLRYRVGVRPLPDTRRTADMVFPGAKVAVFVDGCFWHGCPDHYRPASRNAEFWTAKIAGNVARDADTDARLKAAGWRVIRVWEHEPAPIAARKIMEVVTSG